MENEIFADWGVIWNEISPPFSFLQNYRKFFSFWNLRFILTSSSMIQILLIIKGPSHSLRGEEWHKRNTLWQ